MNLPNYFPNNYALPLPSLRKHDVKNLEYYSFVPASAKDFPFPTKIRWKRSLVAFFHEELKLRLWPWRESKVKFTIE